LKRPLTIVPTTAKSAETAFVVPEQTGKRAADVPYVTTRRRRAKKTEARAIADAIYLSSLAGRDPKLIGDAIVGLLTNWTRANPGLCYMGDPKYDWLWKSSKGRPRE
jgi:hypothetical protein